MTCSFDNKPRWARRKDARPQELLAAAQDLFVERGFASTRLEDVARQAGVSKGTLYLYFTNKEDLFKAVVRENIVPTLGEAEEIIAKFEGSSADLLRSLLINWWQQMGSSKTAGIIKLMMAEAGNFPELAQFYREEVILRSDAMVGSIIRRGIDSGEFRVPDDIHTIRLLVAPALMLIVWNHSLSPCHMDSLDPETYVERFIDICLHGILACNANPGACLAPDTRTKET
jgi:AcrR family transcriptional regulator